MPEFSASRLIKGLNDMQGWAAGEEASLGTACRKFFGLGFRETDDRRFPRSASERYRAPDRISPGAHRHAFDSVAAAVRLLPPGNDGASAASPPRTRMDGTAMCCYPLIIANREPSLRTG
jgi:hypothetical protein